MRPSPLSAHAAGLVAVVLCAGCEAPRGDGSADQGHLFEAVAHRLRTSPVRSADVIVRTALVDLDGDRDDDGLVLFAGPWFCSTAGCELRVYENTGGAFTPIGDGQVVMLTGEARVDPTDVDGWRSLYVEVDGLSGEPDIVRRRLLYDADQGEYAERLHDQSTPPEPVSAGEWDDLEAVLALPSDSTARAVYVEGPLQR